jgi:hypothetical protein
MTKAEKIKTLHEKADEWRKDTYLFEGVKPYSKFEQDLVQTYESMRERFDFSIEDVKPGSKKYIHVYTMYLIIARRLTKSMHRPITGKELDNFMTSETIGSCVESILEKEENEWCNLSKAKKVSHSWLQCVYNTLVYFSVNIYTVYGFIIEFFDIDGRDEIRENFNNIFKHALDFEAEMVSVIETAFVLKNNKK